MWQEARHLFLVVYNIWMKVHLLPLIPGLGLFLVLAADQLIKVDPEGFDAAESTKMDERFSTAAICCFNFCIRVSLANAYSGSSRSCNLAATRPPCQRPVLIPALTPCSSRSLRSHQFSRQTFVLVGPHPRFSGEQGPPASAKGAESCSPDSWKNRFSSLIVTNTAKNSPLSTTTDHYRLSSQLGNPNYLYLTWPLLLLTCTSWWAYGDSPDNVQWRSKITGTK